MSIAVRPFSPADAERWDAFCGAALQATFLHTRRFLSYHGDRFKDCSLLIEEGGKLAGLFPAALSPREDGCVVSHPGITYGGIIHQGGLRGERMIAALSAVRNYFAAQGYTKLLYKAVPTFYHLAPAQDDLYALFRLGGHRTRCDLSSAIDLGHRLPISERRKRGQKKAARAGVEIVTGEQHLSGLWAVLNENLQRKHGVNPVHDLGEITLLAERFPNNIRCICALLDGELVAGILLFITATAWHAQYIASSETGYGCSALDAVFEHAIASAKLDGMRWFDFGISTEEGGMMLNAGLYSFKSEFGAGGFLHEFFELNLGGEHAAI